jgi:hypothetical protein
MLRISFEATAYRKVPQSAIAQKFPWSVPLQFSHPILPGNSLDLMLAKPATGLFHPAPLLSKCIGRKPEKWL